MRGLWHPIPLLLALRAGDYGGCAPKGNANQLVTQNPVYKNLLFVKKWTTSASAGPVYCFLTQSEYIYLELVCVSASYQTHFDHILADATAG